MTNVQLKLQKTSTVATKAAKAAQKSFPGKARATPAFDCFEEDPVVGVVLDSAADSELVATAATWGSATGLDGEPAGLESWKGSLTTGYFTKKRKSR